VPLPTACASYQRATVARASIGHTTPTRRPGTRPHHPAARAAPGHRGHPVGAQPGTALDRGLRSE